MQVNEFARRCGASPHTVRYYARLGLLRPTRAAGNDYQQFSDTDLVRFRVIRAARSVGLSLEQIGDLLHGVPRNGCCNMFRNVLEDKLKEVRLELVRLAEQQRLLEATLAEWSTHEQAFCSPSDSAESPCPVIRVARDSGLDL